MRRLVAALALIGCDRSDPSLLSGTWSAAITDSAALEMRVDGDLDVELCVEALGVQIQIATASLERDTFDAYHLRVTALDSALAVELPLSTLRALEPGELAIASALRTVEYVLRFCRRDGDPGEVLTCESLIGDRLERWTRAVADQPCRSAGACELTGFVDRAAILECVGVAGACELLDAPALAGCVLEVTGARGAAAGELRAACDALAQLESLGVDACDAAPLGELGDARDALCGVICRAGDDCVAELEPACAALARIDDFGLLCCELDAGEAPDAGVDPPACRNGIDDDGDLLTDFPADLQCSSPDDDDESA